MISFIVPGIPQGKGRARATRTGRMYTPAKTASYEGLIAMCGREAMVGRPLMLGPVVLAVRVLSPIPASWSQRKRLQAIREELLPTTKPDADNVLKAIGDGLNGVVWRDDSQLVRVVISKLYAETPGVSVQATELRHPMADGARQPSRSQSAAGGTGLSTGQADRSPDESAEPVTNTEAMQ